MSLLLLAQRVQTEAEAVTSAPTNSQAHARLLQSIHKLTLAAQTPTEALTRIIHQPKQYAALRAAVDMALPRVIVDLNGKSITAIQLATETGGDAVLIARVMRMLTATGLCDEVREDEYKANDTTRELASPAWSDGLKYSYLSMAVNAKFPEFMRSTNFQNPDKSTFEYTYGLPVWEYLKEHPEQQANMMAFMSGRRRGARPWFDIYPLTSQLEAANSGKPDDIILVDVGGNKGHDLKLFQESHPTLNWRLILMDLPDVVKNNVKSSLEGIEMIGYDFFTPQPVQGAHIYYFHGILHDWSDDRCRSILSNTATAMKEHSRLLIIDLVLPNTEAPLPAVAMDFSMMTMCGGMERTENQWRSLLRSTGLEVVKIWMTEGTEAVIEAKLNL